MRCSHLLSNTLMSLLVSLSVGCSIRGNQPAGDPSANAAEPTSQEREAPVEICQELSGNWRTYEFPQGKTKQMCGDEPCEGEGYSGPLKLECQQGKVQGSKLLMFASHPPPGREIRAPVEAAWKNGNFILDYIDSAKCSVTYTLSVKDKKLVGSYSVKNCVGKNWRGNQGEFLAVKAQN